MAAVGATVGPVDVEVEVLEVDELVLLRVIVLVDRVV